MAVAGMALFMEPMPSGVSAAALLLCVASQAGLACSRSRNRASGPERQKKSFSVFCFAETEAGGAICLTCKAKPRRIGQVPGCASACTANAALHPGTRKSRPPNALEARKPHAMTTIKNRPWQSNASGAIGSSANCSMSGRSRRMVRNVSSESPRGAVAGHRQHRVDGDNPPDRENDEQQSC